MHPTNWKCTPPAKWGATKTCGIIIRVLCQISTVILIPRLRFLFLFIYAKTRFFQYFCVKFRAAAVLSRSGRSCAPGAYLIRCHSAAFQENSGVRQASVLFYRDRTGGSKTEQQHPSGFWVCGGGQMTEKYTMFYWAQMSDTADTWALCASFSDSGNWKTVHALLYCNV